MQAFIVCSIARVRLNKNELYFPLIYKVLKLGNLGVFFTYNKLTVNLENRIASGIFHNKKIQCMFVNLEILRNSASIVNTSSY